MFQKNTFIYGKTVRILGACALGIVLMLEQGYASFPDVPPPPTGYLTGGLFAQYFKNAADTPCDYTQGEILAGFNPSNDSSYFTSDCQVGVWSKPSGGDKLFPYGTPAPLLGLGISDPIYTLDLSGTVRLDLPGPEQSGAVLMSNAVGAVAWLSIPSTCVPGGLGNGNLCQGLQTLQSAANNSNYNVGIGDYVMTLGVTGGRNVGVGYAALKMTTTGGSNTAIGTQALTTNSGGNYNVAIGNNALYANTDGNSNTAIGNGSLYSNITGVSNVSIGRNAMDANISGNYNTAIGYRAIYTGSVSISNTAIGYRSLYNTKGDENTAIGFDSMYSNTQGDSNTAVGYYALMSNTTGTGNTVLGYRAGDNLITGVGNIVIGQNADVPNSNASYQLSIGNIIYGTGVDGTGNGFIGIGNKTPSFPLDLSGSTMRIRNPSGSTVSLRFANSINSDGILTYSGGDMNFFVKNSQKMQIGSGGNVGIGYINPQYKLDVNGTIRSTANEAFVWSNNFAKLTNAQGGSIELGGNNTYTGAGTPYIDFHYNGLLQDYNTRIINNGDGRMDYLSSTAYFNGNVGIGDNTPSYKLDVAGTGAFVGVRITGGASPGKILTSDASGNASWQTLIITDTKWDGGNTGLNPATGRASLGLSSITGGLITDGTLTAADIANYTIGTTKINTGAITSGSIADGTVAAADIATDAVTAAKIAQDAVGLSEIANNAVGSGEILNDAVITSKIKDDAVTSAKIANATIVLGDIASSVYSTTADANKLVQRDSNKYVTAAGFVYSSDRNLKKEISPLTGALKKLLSLNGYSFIWRESGRRDIGVIAQEVQKIFPDIVHRDPATGMLSVEYGNLIAPMIEAMKEQQQIIDEQNTRIQSLERRLEVLEAKMK